MLVNIEYKLCLCKFLPLLELTLNTRKYKHTHPWTPLSFSRSICLLWFSLTLTEVEVSCR